MSTMMVIKHKRENYIPKGAKPKKRKGVDGIVYIYNNNSGKPSAVAFRGNAQKPAWRYWFLSLESRDKHIKAFFDNIAAHQKFKQKRQKEQRQGAEVFAKSLKKGQYFRHSWGYDQTNIDFLVIVEVSPSGKSVLCRMAKHIHVGESGIDFAIKPGEATGKTFRLKVADGHLTGSYPYCGESFHRGWFYRIDANDVSYETMPQFGH